jgi:translation initiation factor IF-2
MAIKLIKVAKEFNVGLHTIVEALSNSGFRVDEKPTTDITDEMLVVLQKAFQKDLAIKQEADKLARPALKPLLPPIPGTNSNLLGKTNTLPPLEEKRPTEIPKPVDKPVEKPIEETKAEPKAPEIVKREPAGLKIVGKIDLEKDKKKSNPDAKEPSKTKEEKPKTSEKIDPPTLKETKKEPEPAKPVNAPPSQEEDDFYRAESAPLRGLKILGKINLPTKPSANPAPKDNHPSQRPPQRSGPVANDKANQNNPGSGANNAADDPRKKRKRKKIQQPVTAANLQVTMSGNQGDKKGKGRVDAPKEVSQKEIEDQIKQTMARLGAGASKKRQKIRRDKRDVMRERAELAEIARSEGDNKLQVTEFISVSDLASLLGIKPADIIKSCMTLGIFVSINQRLDAEIIELISSENGFEVQFISAEEQVEVGEEESDDPNDLRPRQPIVTVMGHVDHGKTSLLDFIRNADVASGEAGGITQHIGAYEVAIDKNDAGKKITFLDTPGHEAFTAMRARGAKVTDIAVIVIAADDSIMPQTREAISHAQAAGVPLVFAINKIDKAGADPERIKNELAQMNLLVEEWGGKYQSQDISAKAGLNIDKLLEKVLLEAELLELKANPSRRAVGTVLEASLDKGRGFVTKILVENGSLKKGDPIIAGEFSGKVKAMYNERGKELKQVGPASPVLVLGLPGAPQAGEKIKVTANDSEAKEIANKRAQIIREQSNRANKRISLEEIGRRLALGNFKELKLIVKGDVDGSVEALSDSLIKLSIEKVAVSVIHKAVGQIVDSDIMLASASDAIIIGFQVRPSLTARKLAEKEGVEIKMYSIIYEAIEEVKAAILGMLEPTREEEIMGQVEIREVYKISKIGSVAGCFVQEGKISRNHFVRIIREGIVVYPTNPNQHAELGSLKRFKEDVKEAKNGFECGLTIKNFNDIKPGDVVEAYVINEVKATA